MYNIIVTDEDGYSSLVFNTNDLLEAEQKIAFIVEAASCPNLLINSPVYESIRLEKLEVISRFTLGCER
jgi:hypothetical protein